MSAYLAAHLPHLQSLHNQLALDNTALEADQERIETAIRAAVEALLREREQQVDEYKEVIAGQKRRMSCLARAVGDKGRNVIQESRRESVENESYLNQLAILLGAPFEPAHPLVPIASSSNINNQTLTAPGLARIVSGTAAGERYSTGKRSGSIGSVVNVKGEEGLYDVSEAVTGELEGRVIVALEERASRLVDLESSMHDLRTLHTELALPPIPILHPHHFPIHLLPNRSTEETPGAQSGYEKLLSRIITERVSMARGVDENGEENEVEGDLESMQGVEPEVGLMRWVEEVRELWEKEQSTRAIKIQGFYDQLEPLWQRLQLDQDQIDLFIQMNIGCSEAAIKATELERCLELRRSSLSSFIIAVRAEIEALWTELMLSDDEKSDFGAYINDDYCEELLAEHEAYIEQLRAEIESKAVLLPKVRIWHSLVEEEDELERMQCDPDRFKRRGGAMLREEKLRKRVEVAKPKIEQELLKRLPAWEEANGRPFMVQGERVVDKIQDALEAKDQVKEAKKRIRQGLAPTAPTKPLAPAKTVRPTPSHTSRSTTTQSSIARKREAPTPTPAGTLAGTAKRQKISQAPMLGSGAPSGIRQPSRMPPTGSRIPSSSSSSIVGRVISQTRSAPTRERSRSPTIVSACGLPRPGESRLPIARLASASTTASTSVMALQVQLPPLHNLAKANGRRPPRKSFRPRQSIMCGMISGSLHDADEGEEEGHGEGEVLRVEMGMMEEEEDGDVFE